MRIASLLPSATEIICALGLREQLVGVTHECDFPPGIQNEKPILVENCLVAQSHGASPPPAEVDRQVKEALLTGKGVYQFKTDLLEKLKPELIVTQGLCDVCAVPYETVVNVAARMNPQPRVISLDPPDVTGVLADIRRVGEATNRIDEAGTVVEDLEARIGDVIAAANERVERTGKRPRVLCLEWTDPIFVGGHWIPEMVEMAGGVDVLGIAGKPSFEMPWEKVLLAKPEIIVVMPCGYDEAKARRELPRLEARPGWADLPAVKNKRVHFTNANAYYSRPGPRIVDGLELLAKIIAG